MSDLSPPARDQYGRFSGTKPNPSWTADERYEHRFKQLVRAYMRHLGIGRKPTVIEAALIRRAASLTTKAEFASLDPNSAAGDCAKLDHAAERARNEMFRHIARPPEQRSSLREMLMAEMSGANNG